MMIRLKQTKQVKNYEDAFGAAVAAHLSESVDNIGHDIAQRLKAARMQAAARRRVIKFEFASSISASGGTAALHGNNHPIWSRLASLVPLFGLVIGLLAIGFVEEEKRTNDLANVDMEILTDELPPAAYTDPGFAQFLRSQHGD